MCMLTVVWMFYIYAGALVLVRGQSVHDLNEAVLEPHKHEQYVCNYVTVLIYAGALVLVRGQSVHDLNEAVLEPHKYEQYVCNYVTVVKCMQVRVCFCGVCLCMTSKKLF